MAWRIARFSLFFTCFLAACGSDDGSSSPETSDASDATADVSIDSSSDTATTDTGARDSAPDVAPADANDAADTSEAGDVGDETDTFDAGAKACNPKTGGCDPSTEYCDAPTCDNGTCKPKPTSPSTVFDPTCGCDGVTYWNAEQGYAQGASVRVGSGACVSPDAKTCAGFTAKPCTAVETCVIDASTPATCSVADFGGRCWYVPPGATCPSGSADYRQCEGSSPSSCTTYCGAVTGHQIFFKDATCP